MLNKALLTLDFMINYHQSNLEKYKNNQDQLQAGRLAVLATEAVEAIKIYQFIKTKILIHV